MAQKEKNMDSKIAKAIKLNNEPIAVFISNEPPEQAVQFRKGVWGCVIAMMNAVSKGKTAAFNKETVVCAGGRAGLGIQKFELGNIEYFLSTGREGLKKGELYKRDPELARCYIQNMPVIETNDFVVLKPLSQVQEHEEPKIIVFMVNVDQLSGLVTLANYDQETQDNVKLSFGAGCAQSILYGLDAAQKNQSACYIGLTDPSARKCIPKDILSFTVPFKRYLEMEKCVDSSFLQTDTWRTILKRI